MIGKVIQHPSATNTPAMTVAEAIGLADKMVDVCIMWTDHDGNMHIGWSKQTNADLACYGVVLNYIAANRIIGDTE